jgi:hypothetical protein
MKHTIDKFLPEQLLTFGSLFDDLPTSEFESLFAPNTAARKLSPERYRQIFKVLSVVTSIQEQAKESSKVAELLARIKRLSLKLEAPPKESK